MTLVPLDRARAHLRADDDYPAEQIQIYLEAAEEDVQAFLNRRVYADSDALDEALAGIPAFLESARARFAAAVIAADAIVDPEPRGLAVDAAADRYTAARYSAGEVYAGMVVNKSITAAVLLVMGHLFANREDTVAGTTNLLPEGSRSLLQPWRVGLGV